MPFVSALITVGGNLLGGELASNAAEDAASTAARGAIRGGDIASRGQLDAAKTLADAYTASGQPLATAATTAAGQRAQGALAGGEAVGTALKPYTDAGSAAIGQIQQGLTAGGQFNRPFTMADATNSAAMKSALELGRQAIEGSAASKSGLLSSNALNATMDYGQKVGAQYEAQAFDQWLNQQKMALSGLLDVAGIGSKDAALAGTAMGQGIASAADATAAGTTGAAEALQNAALGAAKSTATGQIGSSEALANAQLAAAGAKASGEQAQGNIWSNVLSGGIGDIAGAYSMNKVLGNSADPLYKMSDMTMPAVNYALR